MESTLQIRNVEVEGFGNIGHVVMRELQDRIILEGVNGVGKTMILTAICAALIGKTALPSERPLSEWIKEGYENALIKLDLANGKTVQFSIRVIITANDFDLTIKEVSEDGKSKKIPGGPMAFLKTIVNAIAFHPQQWRKKNDAEQLEEVFNFFPGLKEKLSANDKKLSDAEQERARLLAKAKVLRLDIERVPFTPNLPEKEVDPAEIASRLKAAQDHNKELDNLKTDLKAASDEVKTIEDSIAAVRKERGLKEEMLKQIQLQIDQADKEIETKTANKMISVEKVNQLTVSIKTFEVTPTDPIDLEIAEVNKKNESIRSNLARSKNQKDLEDAELKANLEYKKTVTIKEERNAIMATAEIPVDGLSIGDGCLLYPNSNMDMVRLSALSDGEFWPVACGLVAAFNPRVRIVIIDNLHDLDKSNYDELSKTSKKYGMQLWVHKTLWEESEAGAGFLIRDGQIISEPKTK